MKYLTRQEELILLTIFRLKESAYLVSIKNHLIEFTNKEWTLGAVYVPLERLQRFGYLDTFIGESTAKRGGRAIKFYKIAKSGIKALAETQKLNNVMWNDFSEYIKSN